MSSISENQREKLNNLQNITSLSEEACKRILRASDWNLHIALNRVYDGELDQESQPGNTSSESRDPLNVTAIRTSSQQESQPSFTQMRRRNLQNFVPNNDSTSFVDNISKRDDNQSRRSGNSDRIDRHDPRSNFDGNSDTASNLALTVWNNIPWIIRLPFSIFFRATQVITDFFASIINPTLYYDSTGTVQRFIDEFNSQYGQIHPEFWPDSYSNLISHAKRELQFALIYIHSPKHRDTERFCRNVVATERFRDFISSQNVIFWSCNSFFPDGYAASQAVSFTSYPFIFLVGLKNSKMVILKTFEGYQNLETTISKIKKAIDNNESHLIAARLDRETNIVNSLIRQQQDAALEESLRKDQEKERKMKEEADKKAEEKRIKQKKVEDEQKRMDFIMDLKKILLDELEVEPEISSQESIKLLFRLPNGKRLERRFLKSHPVKQLYFYVFCNDESLINFKLRTNFPTKELPGHSPIPEVDLNSEEMNRQLQYCGLQNNIVLFVHDLDA